jgi:hypothetical protein
MVCPVWQCKLFMTFFGKKSLSFTACYKISQTHILVYLYVAESRYSVLENTKVFECVLCDFTSLYTAFMYTYLIYKLTLKFGNDAQILKFLILLRCHACDKILVPEILM